ncbi:MAG: hypothetical protein HYY30_09370 [Chloroflexi bacterium]|nr:hypothetical protein [Chloroflexota bacterium]
MNPRFLLLTCSAIALSLTVISLGCAQPPAPTATPKPAVEQPKPIAPPTKAVEQPKPAAPAPPAASPTTAVKTKEPVIVRVGLMGSASADAASFIADARGYFKEQGVQFQHVPWRIVFRGFYAG